MSQPPRRRVLAFEQLEAKVAPSSVPLPTLGEADELATRTSAQLAKLGVAEAAPLGNWRFLHDTEQLLTFIAENTVDSTLARTGHYRPTEIECLAADEMMRLDAAALRSWIVF